MNLIAHLDQHQLGYVSVNDKPISWTRHAARAVMLDSGGRVALMFFTTTGSYKLPGGGIDEGEAITSALRREVREESGYEITDIHELGVVEEDRYARAMHQTSHCFLVEAAKFVGSERTKKEVAEGMRLRWIDSFEEAIRMVEGNATPDSGDDRSGHEMMKLREIAILKTARNREVGRD